MHHEAILVFNLVESSSREHSLSRCDLSHLAREHIQLCLPRLFSADVDRAHVRNLDTEYLIVITGSMVS